MDGLWRHSSLKACVYLVELLLLLLQVGDDLPEVVLVHQQVVQLLLETVLGFVQLIESSTFLLQALGCRLKVPQNSLLSFLGGLQTASVLLQLLLHLSELHEVNKRYSEAHLFK